MVEFFGPADLIGRIPAPFPAAQAVPGWLKAIPAQRPAVQEVAPGFSTVMPVQTIKRCMPFLDAIVSGYILPLITRVHIRVTETGVEAQTDNFRVSVVSLHVAEQLTGTPLGDKLVLKINSPWIVRTPPGVSCLFVQPLNRPPGPIEALAGVVETDTYYREINFPVVCHLRPGESAVLESGTPLVQVIPFRREAWQMAVSPRDDAAREKVVRGMDANPHLYRDEHWCRKNYGNPAT